MSSDLNEQEAQNLLDASDALRTERSRGEDPSVEEFGRRLGESSRHFAPLMQADLALEAAMSIPKLDPLPRRFGNYTLVRIIGRGGAGIVYEAFQPGLGRRVALKMLRPGAADHPRTAERFRREARACAAVRHDHVVPIHEAGVVDGAAFYVMELIDGESLDALVQDGRAPSPQALCAGMAGIAHALHALHLAGIVHRDVKPSNVMVRSDGKMILADFGLARVTDALSVTNSGDAVGTPLYMSPEQLRGRTGTVDARSDVYGLGAALYFGLAKQPPFPGTDHITLAESILRARPTPVRQVDPACPEACEQIALKCLEKEPADRYVNAQALAHDLEAFAVGRPVAGRPVGPATRAQRAVRRKLLPLLAAAVLLAGVGFWWVNRPATLSLAGGFPAGVQISIAGSAHGQTPQALELARGVHTIVFSHELCEPETRTVELSAGGSMTASWTLLPRKAQEEAYLALLAEARDVRLAPLVVPARHRGASDEPPIQVLVPRGNVVLGDLQQYAMFADLLGADEQGEVRFLRAGDDQPLWSAPFQPKGTRVLADVPAAVRDALRPGDVITWGWFPGPKSERNAKPETTTFTVVADTPVPDLDRLADINPIVRRPLEARVLLNQGRRTSAFWRAMASIRAGHYDRRSTALLYELLTEWNATGELAAQVRARLIDPTMPAVSLLDDQ